jgi:hypothetical protein
VLVGFICYPTPFLKLFQLHPKPSEKDYYFLKTRRSEIAQIRHTSIHFNGLKSPGLLPSEIGIDVNDGVGIGSGKSCGILM